jgi:tetratricopeptide (TPR) repeat protein
MKTLFLALLAATLASPAAEPLPQVRDARKHLEQKQPAQATAVLEQIAARQPNDPYIAYDLGVVAFAAGKYDEADRIWQELAARQLPDKLRDNVWQQVGNVSFRRGELAEKVKIEDALPLWEQSREAYRIVLAARPKDEVTQHNLKIVERKLAQLHSQLAKRLLKEAEKQSLEKTIEKLQAAVDHQRTAHNLVPENQQYQQELKETEKKLADNYTTKAMEEEKTADTTLKKPATNRWERERAEDNLQTALTDFREAKALTPENQAANEGEKRVLEKLSKLLTESGKELQKEAQQQEQHNPENAEARYEQALEKFEEALKIDEKNEPAKQGEQEVRQALEKLHMREGDKQAEQGRKDVPNQPAKAAEEMMDAVRHYEQAQAANPLNTEAQPKIDALQKELPPHAQRAGQAGTAARGRSRGQEPGESRGPSRKSLHQL